MPTMEAAIVKTGEPIQIVRLNAQLNLMEGVVQLLFENFEMASGGENWEVSSMVSSQ